MKAFILGNASQFRYGLSVHVYYVFSWEYFFKFLVISKTFILFNLRPGEVRIYPETVIFVSDSQEN